MGSANFVIVPQIIVFKINGWIVIVFAFVLDLMVYLYYINNYYSF